MQRPQHLHVNEQLLDGIYFARPPESLEWPFEFKLMFVKEAYFLIPALGGGEIGCDWLLSLRNQYIAFKKSCLLIMVQSENMYSYKSSQSSLSLSLPHHSHYVHHKETLLKRKRKKPPSTPVLRPRLTNSQRCFHA
jgi:hypothetical protein